MSICSLIIRDGKFINTPDVQLISNHEAKVKDWECSISSKGIKCVCLEPYNGYYAKLKYVILKNGFCRLTLQLPGCSAKIIKEYWVSKPGAFDFNGVISFYSSNIQKPIVSFKRLTK